MPGTSNNSSKDTAELRHQHQHQHHDQQETTTTETATMSTDHEELRWSSAEDTDGDEEEENEAVRWHRPNTTSVTLPLAMRTAIANHNLMRLGSATSDTATSPRMYSAYSTTSATPTATAETTVMTTSVTSVTSVTNVTNASASAIQSPVAVVTQSVERAILPLEPVVTSAPTKAPEMIEIVREQQQQQQQQQQQHSSTSVASSVVVTPIERRKSFLSSIIERVDERSSWRASVDRGSDGRESGMPSYANVDVDDDEDDDIDDRDNGDVDNTETNEESDETESDEGDDDDESSEYDNAIDIGENEDEDENGSGSGSEYTAVATVDTSKDDEPVNLPPKRIRSKPKQNRRPETIDSIESIGRFRTTTANAPQIHVDSTEFLANIGALLPDSDRAEIMHAIHASPRSIESWSDTGSAFNQRVNNRTDTSGSPMEIVSTDGQPNSSTPNAARSDEGIINSNSNNSIRATGMQITLPPPPTFAMAQSSSIHHHQQQPQPQQQVLQQPLAQQQQQQHVGQSFVSGYNQHGLMLPPPSPAILSYYQVDNASLWGMIKPSYLPHALHQVYGAPPIMQQPHQQQPQQQQPQQQQLPSATIMTAYGAPGQAILMGQPSLSYPQSIQQHQQQPQQQHQQHYFAPRPNVSGNSMAYGVHPLHQTLPQQHQQYVIGQHGIIPQPPHIPMLPPPHVMPHVPGTTMSTVEASTPAGRDALLQHAHAMYISSPTHPDLIPMLRTLLGLHQASHLPTALLLACVHFSRGDLHLSLTYNLHILSLDPDYVESMSNIGTTLRKMGYLREAERWWWRAVRLRPGYWDAVENLLSLLCHPPSISTSMSTTTSVSQVLSAAAAAAEALSRNVQNLTVDVSSGIGLHGGALIVPDPPSPKSSLMLASMDQRVRDAAIAGASLVSQPTGGVSSPALFSPDVPSSAIGPASAAVPQPVSDSANKQQQQQQQQQHAPRPKFSKALQVCEYVESSLRAAALSRQPNQQLQSNIPEVHQLGVSHSQLPRLQNLFYQKGTILNALGQQQKAAREYEKAVETMLDGRTLLGTLRAAADFGKQNGAFTFQRSQESEANLPVEGYVNGIPISLPLVLFMPEHVTKLIRGLFPEGGGVLPGMVGLSPASSSSSQSNNQQQQQQQQPANNNNNAPGPAPGSPLQSCMHLTSTILLTLSKLYTDHGLVQNTQAVTFLLYYLCLAIVPSPSTCNNLGIMLCGIATPMTQTQIPSIVQQVHDTGLMQQYEREIALRKQQHAALAAAAAAAQLPPPPPPIVPPLPAPILQNPTVSASVGAALAMRFYYYGLTLNNKHPHLYTNLGSLLKDLGFIDEAIRMYKQAIDSDPNFDVALANLGNALKDQGKVSESVEWYLRATKANPNFVEAICGLANTLATICEWRGRNSATVNDITRAGQQAIHKNHQIMLKRQQQHQLLQAAAEKLAPHGIVLNSSGQFVTAPATATATSSNANQLGRKSSIISPKSSTPLASFNTSSNNNNSSSMAQQLANRGHALAQRLTTSFSSGSYRNSSQVTASTPNGSLLTPGGRVTLMQPIQPRLTMRPGLPNSTSNMFTTTTTGFDHHQQQQLVPPPPPPPLPSSQFSGSGPSTQAPIAPTPLIFTDSPDDYRDPIAGLSTDLAIDIFTVMSARKMPANQQTRPVLMAIPSGRTVDVSCGWMDRIVEITHNQFRDHQSWAAGLLLPSVTSTQNAARNLRQQISGASNITTTTTGELVSRALSEHFTRVREFASTMLNVAFGDDVHLAGRIPQGQSLQRIMLFTSNASVALRRLLPSSEVQSGLSLPELAERTLLAVDSWLRKLIISEGGWAIRTIERLGSVVQWRMFQYAASHYQHQHQHQQQQPPLVWTRPTLPAKLAQPPLPTVLPFHTFTYPLDGRIVRMISYKNAIRVSHSVLSAPWLPRSVYPPPPPPFTPQCPRLVIGYVSSDFTNHPLAHLTQSVYGMHDRTRFHVIGYATTKNDGSAFRAKIERESETFRDVSSWSFQQIVEQIVRDGVHILVNLNGYTKGAKNEIFAARPAPILASYLGYAGSMGAQWCDWFIVDPIVCPPDTVGYERRKQLLSDRGLSVYDGEDASMDDGELNPEDSSTEWMYTERIVYMPHTYFVSDHRQGFREASDVNVVDLPQASQAHQQPQQLHSTAPLASPTSLHDLAWANEQAKRLAMRRELFPTYSDDTFIFANFNQLYKIDPICLRTWLRILSRVPHAILWLLRFPPAGEAHIKRTAEEWAGPDVARRVVFTDIAPKHQHVARGRIADLFLDTFECNAHTTAMDIMWTATPILTWPRHRHKFCSRVAASIVSATGFGRALVARSAREYEDKAVKLAMSVYNPPSVATTTSASMAAAAAAATLASAVSTTVIDPTLLSPSSGVGPKVLPPLIVRPGGPNQRATIMVPRGTTLLSTIPPVPPLPSLPQIAQLTAPQGGLIRRPTLIAPGSAASAAFMLSAPQQIHQPPVPGHPFTQPRPQFLSIAPQMPLPTATLTLPHVASLALNPVSTAPALPQMPTQPLLTTPLAAVQSTPPPPLWPVNPESMTVLEIRRHLFLTRDRSRLYDTPRWVYNVEKAYVEMWNRFADGRMFTMSSGAAPPPSSPEEDAMAAAQDSWDVPDDDDIHVSRAQGDSVSKRLRYKKMTDAERANSSCIWIADDEDGYNTVWQDLDL